PVIFGLSLLSTLVFASDITIHGFVTAVKSPSSFQIDDYTITRDKSVSLEFDKQADQASILPFTPENIRIGTELEVTGEYDDDSRALKARSIKVFFDDNLIVKRTAVLEKMPALTRSDSG